MTSVYFQWTKLWDFSTINIYARLQIYTHCLGYANKISAQIEIHTLLKIHTYKWFRYNNGLKKAVRLKGTWQHSLQSYFQAKQVFWKNVLWTYETIVEMFGHNAQWHIWQKPNTAYQHKHLVPTVSTKVEGWRFQASCAATGHLEITELSINSSVVVKNKIRGYLST